MAAVIVALAAALTAFATREIRAFRHSANQRLTTMAAVLGSSVEDALLYEDREAAEQTLSILEAAPEIDQAWVYDHTGRPLAGYTRPDSDVGQSAPALQPEGIVELRGRPAIFREVRLDGRELGILYLRFDPSRLYRELLHSLLVVAVIVAIGAGAAYGLASRLQRYISGPILELAVLAQRISTEKDYSLRVAKRSHDEIGVLIDQFNTMLEEINRRDRELLAAQADLEDRVVERTRKLGTEIEERERYERMLVEKTRDLERSNADLEQFAYIASHDLQEPLRMVGSFVQLLSRRYKDRLDEDADEFIGYAVDGAARMQRMINALLTFSRVGTRALDVKPTDSRQVLDDVLANLRIALEESAVLVESGSLPTVTVDASQLGQVFQNLLSNALKFRGSEAPRIEVVARQQDATSWVFSIQDNGIGFDPAQAERIFHFFQRLVTDEAHPGNGMGLAVCKKIVQRWGGRIWADAAPGRGATFFFSVPAADGE